MIRSVESVFREGTFNGKVAIVTGGGTGIGKCIAHELCALGCSVVITSRKLEALELAAKEIKAELPPSQASRDCVYVVQCDVRQEDQVKELFVKTMKKFNRIDYLVNNAGGQFIAPFDKLTLKGWNAVHRLNLDGTFLMIKYAYEAYMRDHGGAIVNILVNMGKGFPMASHSGSSRAGVENLTKSLAYEWAHKGIRLNCVSPGTILSSGVSNYGPEGYKMFEQQSKNWPAKRMGTVEEVSAATVFLLSPAASYTTGTNAVVDGGWLLSGSIADSPDHEEFPIYGKSKL